MTTHHHRPAIAGLLAMLISLLVWGQASAVEYDTIIRGGLVYDGNGSPGFIADVAIQGDRIAAVGDLSQARTDHEIDASGKVVAPGFVNMLSWAVGSLISDGHGLSDIKQGVTLEVFGEGWSMGPMPEGREDLAVLESILGDNLNTIEWDTLGEYLEFLERRGVSLNVASFVGATTLRIHEIGFDDRPPTPEEMENMKALTRQAMEEGAMGLGTSLIYPPAFFATTEELVELARVVHEYDGMYASHMRSEGNRIEQSVQELITIAREAGIGAEIYHLKMGGKQNWDKLPGIVKMIEDARAEGLNITTDMYTYIAGGTGLAASFPPWASDGGMSTLIERLRNPESRAKIIAAMREDSDDWENLYYGAGPDGILFMTIGKDELKQYLGKTLGEVARERGTNPEETAADLVVEAEGMISAMYFMMDEENVKAQIKLPWMSFGSDAEAVAPEGKVLEQGVHPRAYGNFARLLGKYVRDEKVIPMEEAIYKLTSLPAGNLKIAARGNLKEGYFADVVVFDPKTIADRATFEQPHQLAVGMAHVFVNGQQVLEDGEHTGALPGRVVRGPGYKGGTSKSAGPGLDDPGVVEAFVDGLVTPLMKINNSPSGTVAIVKDGQLMFAKGYGYQDLDEQSPVDPERTLFRPGSVSKLFTWVAVMQLVEQGKLNLDADINDYLTTFQIKDTFAEPITMRHIMTHTSGFEDGFLGYLIMDDESRLMPLGEFVERYQPARVNPPGVQTAYSNYATVLAGLIASSISGMSFNDYIQAHIFDVLGMEHSSFEEPLPDHLIGDMAAGYVVENGAFTERPFELISNFGPAGALTSSATDMVKFAQAILNGGELDGRRILEPETVKQMLTRNFSHDDRLMGVALGFFETEVSGVRLIGHGGSTPLFHSDLGIDQQHGLAFFVSFSGAGGSNVRSAFAPAFYDTFFPQADERPVPPEDFAGRAGKYAGSYAFWRRNFSTVEKAMGLGGSVQVVPTEDNFLAVAFGGKTKQYVEIEKNLFQEREPGLSLVAGISPRYVAFQENDKGEITGFVMDGLSPMSLGKLPFYATANFNWSAVALSLLVFFGVILRRLYQRAAFKAWPAEDKVAMRSAVLAALSNLLVVAFIAIMLIIVGDRLIYEIPLLFKLTLLFPILATLAGIYLLYECFVVWKNGLLAGQWARVRFTVVALCALFMCWFYYYWNMLGYQYMS